MWLTTEAGLFHRTPTEWTVNPEVEPTSRLFAAFHQSFLYDEETVRRVDLVTETSLNCLKIGQMLPSLEWRLSLVRRKWTASWRAARSLEISDVRWTTSRRQNADRVRGPA